MCATKLPNKDLFELPDGVIYLDGNSLGPLPKSVNAHAAKVISSEWGEQLIRSWNTSGWMEQPVRVGDQIGQLIGAPPGSVVAGDTLSIKVYQALGAALEMRPRRKVVLSDSGNFPTDLYMADGLIISLAQDHELRIVAPDAVEACIDETIAAVMLTEVDYRTGRKHDMARITRAAHASGAVMIWDLAHSAGAFPVDLAGCNCEFAVGCTYKFLNGGPGAPAFIYLRPDVTEQARPSLSGWLGHDAPFAFEQRYRPAGNIERMRVGTPSVIQMSILEEALKIWDDIDLDKLRTASIRLSQRFIDGVETTCPQLKLNSPRDPEQRGSQVSFAFEHGFAVMQALIERGVIGDFRAPDIMRFGITPLFLSESDIDAAIEILQDVIVNRLWDKPEYKRANRVT